MRKKILEVVSLVVIIGLSGCVNSAQSLEYAKSNGLSEDLYSDATIIGILDNKIKLNENEINSYITNVTLKKYDYVKECNRNARMSGSAEADNFRRSVGLGNRNASDVYSRCIDYYKSQFKTTKKSFQNKNIVAYDLKQREAKGYWGYEIKGDKKIVFAKGYSMRTGVSNYIKGKQFVAKHVDGSEYKTACRTEKIKPYVEKTIKLNVKFRKGSEKYRKNPYSDTRIHMETLKAEVHEEIAKEVFQKVINKNKNKNIIISKSESPHIESYQYFNGVKYKSYLKIDIWKNYNVSKDSSYANFSITNNSEGINKKILSCGANDYGFNKYLYKIEDRIKVYLLEALKKRNIY